MPMIFQDPYRCQIGDWVPAEWFEKKGFPLQEVLQVLPEPIISPLVPVFSSDPPISEFQVSWMFRLVSPERLYPGEKPKYERVA